MVLDGLTLFDLSKHSDFTANGEFADQLYYVIQNTQGAFLPFLVSTVPKGFSQDHIASHFELICFECENYLVSSNFISRVTPD